MMKLGIEQAPIVPAKSLLPARANVRRKTILFLSKAPARVEVQHPAWSRLGLDKRNNLPLHLWENLDDQEEQST
jgi:hypothetical protein